MSPQDKIVDRIRKLLALARNNPNEAEADAAMAKASAMMIEHDIKNIEDAVTILAEQGGWNKYDVPGKHAVLLSMAIAKLYNCRILLRDNKKECCYIGKPEAIQVCELTQTFIDDQMKALFKKAKDAVGGRKAFGSDHMESFRRLNEFRRSFREGCAMRVGERVHEIIRRNRANIPASTALVVIDQSLAAADDVIKKMNVKKSRPLAIRDGLGTGAGIAAGNMIKIQQEVRN